MDDDPRNEHGQSIKTPTPEHPFEKMAETLPCDVLLPPATLIRKGCPYAALLTAFRARGDCPAEALRFNEPSRSSRLSEASDVFRDGIPVTVTARDYHYEGRLAGVVWKASGAIRYVIEDAQGRLFIHNAEQLGEAEGWVP
jgi:hypothetical protein